MREVFCGIRPESGCPGLLSLAAFPIQLGQLSPVDVVGNIVNRDTAVGPFGHPGVEFSEIAQLESDAKGLRASSEAGGGKAHAYVFLITALRHPCNLDMA